MFNLHTLDIILLSGAQTTERLERDLKYLFSDATKP